MRSRLSAVALSTKAWSTGNRSASVTAACAGAGDSTSDAANTGRPITRSGRSSETETSWTSGFLAGVGPDPIEIGRQPGAGLTATASGSSYGCKACNRAMASGRQSSQVLISSCTSVLRSIAPFQRYSDCAPGSWVTQAASRSSSNACAMRSALSASGQVLNNKWREGALIRPGSVIPCLRGDRAPIPEHGVNCAGSGDAACLSGPQPLARPALLQGLVWPPRTTGRLGTT